MKEKYNGLDCYIPNKLFDYIMIQGYKKIVEDELLMEEGDLWVNI